MVPCFPIRCSSNGAGAARHQSRFGSWDPAASCSSARISRPPASSTRGTAPPLLAGVRYRFQVQPASPSSAQEVWFELVNPADARRIRRELLDLEEALAAAPPPAPTLAELRAGLLASRGLLHDARLALAEEIVRHPDEPTLHFLLGDLYLRQGLPEEASESFTEAKILMSGAGSARQE